MKFFMRTAALAAIVAGAMAFGPAHDPVKALQDLQQFAQKEYSTVKSQEAFNAAQVRVAAKAKELVDGVDPAKVDAKECGKWAQIFEMAKMPSEATVAAERYLGTTENEGRFSTQLTLLGLYADQNKTEKISDLIEKVQPSNPQEMMSLVSVTAYQVVGKIKAANGVTAAINTLDSVQKFVKLKGISDPKDKQMEESALYGLASAKIDLYKEANKTKESLNALDEAVKMLDPDSKMVKRFATMRNQITLIGTAAPEIKVERGYGKFAGLSSLKGKVVLVDFFAHWCGPCKAAFPDMEKLYSDFHDKGLEIVGYTTYYGYFGKERGLAPDAEFAKMDGFIKDFKLPWPIQFGDRSAFENYGVTGIPHVAVIDRTGKVRDLHIGYSPESFAPFRAEVEKLLAEK